MSVELVAVDVGGTKMALRAYSPGAQVLRSMELPTANLPVGQLAFLDSVIQVVHGFASSAMHRLGVAWNCPIRHGVAAHSSLLGGAAGTDLLAAFRCAFGVEVAVESDVHAMTLGHAKFGSGIRLDCFCLLNLGTGVGLGCWDGGLRRGRGAAGLVCHEPVWIAELAAFWTVDDTVSGRGIAALHSALGGEQLAAKDVVLRAAQDAAARRTMEVYAYYLARVLAMISRTFDPEVIIIDGSVRHSWNLIGTAVLGHYERFVEPFMAARVCASGLDSSACLGVAFGGEALALLHDA